MRFMVMAAVLGVWALSGCERAEPHREPHQAMMPPGVAPMPHADGAMERAMQMTTPGADASPTNGH